MTYNSLSDLTSITDPDNNTTQYIYSSAGNLLSIAYPDGTAQSFTYNPVSYTHLSFVSGAWRTSKYGLISKARCNNAIAC